MPTGSTPRRASTRRVRAARAPGAGPVAVLVAAGGSPPGRAVVAGELVWIPLPCGRRDCSCTADFEGVVTRGITDVARVATLPDASRAEVRRAIVAGMCRDCVPPALARAQAEWLLDAAEGVPEGTLMRRDAAGRIVPVTPGRTW